MKQRIIESQTTPILYQHPTAEEQRPTRWQYVWVNAKEFGVFAILAFMFWLVINFFLINIGA